MNLKSLKRKLSAFGGALVASCLVLTPVWADDTEIFYADVGGDSLWPNLLFIIDTSGSMSNTVYDSNGNSTGKDRLEHVQDAFVELLSTLSNVNVGLMRFSNPGGPILYPVANLDAEVTQISDATIISRVSNDADDAQETADGTMRVNDEFLTMVELTAGLTYFNDFLEFNNDDAEERFSNGDMSRSSSDLDFYGGGITAGSRRYVGLHFNGSGVPAGATITSAFITFTADNGGNSIPVELLIYAEPSDSSDGSSAFDGDDYDISSRDRTTAFAPWTIVDATIDGDQVITPNLKDVVQEVVDHPDWQVSESDMTFIIVPTGTGLGHREMESVNGAGSIDEHAKLTIQYYTGSSEPTATLAKTGLRFRNLNIPRGVDITNAYIEFVSSEAASGAYSYTIVAEDNPGPSAYSSTPSDIDNRTYTDETSGESVPWAGSGSLDVGEAFRTPDISSLIQAVTDDSWCGGNDLAFMITGTEGQRVVHSHDGDSSLSPRLVVNYDPSTIPDGTSCYEGLAVARTSASSDDAEHSSSSFNTTSSTLNFDSGRHIGVRFPDIAIPKDAEITRAYLELTQKNHDDGGSATITISVEDTENAEPYASDNRVRSRTYATTKDVTWSLSETWREDVAYQSTDIKALVDHAVSKSNWQAGNAIAFRLLRTGSNDREVYSFNSSPGDAPRLVVEFNADGSGRVTRTVREELISVVNGLSHNGYTPVQDTLYEAAQYYTGGEVTWGKKRGGPNDSGPHSYTRVSHAGSMVPNTYSITYPDGCTEGNLGDSACRYQEITGDARYKSPLISACQQESHIVLLTDGYANRDHSETEIKSFIGKSTCTDGGTADGGDCVHDLVKYLHETDQSSLAGDQFITTHAIGFDFASEWLRDVAVNGGGEFTATSSAQGLIDTIEDIVVDVQKTDNTFVAPVAAVNQFNRLNHLSSIYFAVFRPDETPRWAGNVKKYNLGEDNVVLDKNNNPAVSAGTGFFDENSVDLWDANPGDGLDGFAVEKGGAASRIPHYDSRKVYTYHRNSTSAVLSTSENRLHTDNLGDPLTKEMFGASDLTNDEFTILLQWIRGRDLTPERLPRYAFNDPLHSRPVAVTYNVSEENPDVTIYVGTNGGSLQAINAATGVEEFIFFPEATLPLQRRLLDNNPSIEHLYGIDGHIVPWINDNQANGINPSDPKDFVKLFFGMRRGGYNYYAMDVTDRANPEIDWVLEGGVGAFSEMGQSWGTPIPGKVRLPGETEPTDVLFISGGYDPAKDDETIRGEDTSGRAVYIVDAATGTRIWSASPAATTTNVNDPSGYNQQFSAMKYSIPSSLTVADVNADGLDDLILVGDTGGQVWRFDISQAKPFVEDTAPDAEPGQFVTGGVIADLGVAGGTNTEEANRRFYHAPDVALVERDRKRELAITIGSGFRAHPLNTAVEDRFYMLRQKAVFSPPTTYDVITESDLYDTTDNRVADGVDASGTDADVESEEAGLASKMGWYINLHNPDVSGEKVLSTPLTFRDRVVFITYTPSNLVVDCKARAGISKVYYVNLADGSPVKNWDDSTNSGDDCDGANCDQDDRYFQLETPSIIDEPVVICTEQGCDVFTGAEKPPIDRLEGDRVVKTYWRKDN